MKRKNEGFSLIELLTVIAIMIVLMALLVPSVIGYIRKASIAAMNANAKQVHNAVSASMAQLTVSGVRLNTNSSAHKNAKASNMFIAASDGNKIQVVFRINNNLVVANNTSYGLTDKADMVSYLGKGFDGNVVAYINPVTYSVDCVVYAEKTSPIGVNAGWLSANQHPCLRRADSHIDNDANGNLVNNITPTAQARDAADGYLYGVYPYPRGLDSDSR